MIRFKLKSCGVGMELLSFQNYFSWFLRPAPAGSGVATVQASAACKPLPAGPGFGEVKHLNGHVSQCCGDLETPKHIRRDSILHVGQAGPLLTHQLRRCMSTGGTSHKDCLLGISGHSRRLKEERHKDTDSCRQDSWPLSPEGKRNTDFQQALERRIFEAYRLLQEGKVEPAEHLISEGLRSAETLLADNDPVLCQLSDQIALLQFFQGRFKDAAVHAQRSMLASQKLPEGEGKAAAIAMCSMRLGTILLGLKQRAEAVALLEEAHRTLLPQFGAKYEPVNEAAYYLALARLPEALTAQALESIEERLVQALRSMGSRPGVGSHLLRAGVREHRALVDRAVDAQDWDLAEAILQQAVRIQTEVCPGSEEFALTTYQYGTLQYVRGLHNHAEAACADSLALARRLYRKDSSNQVALRLHRLGTLYLATGSSQQAINALQQSCKSLMHNVGEANPLTGESRAALALAKLSQLDDSPASADPYHRILKPGRRQKLLAEMQAGLSIMQRGFGADHMLVRKMRHLSNQITGC